MTAREKETTVTQRFTGFPREGIEFFAALAGHNDREWFLAHKDSYERACRAPMQALAAELEPRLGEAWISRINRDLRFAKDRAPYKTHIAAAMGGRYIGLSAEGLFVGGGLYKPEPAVLQRLRAAIDDPETGTQLGQIVKSLRRKGYDVKSHEVLSSAPRGYDPAHPRIDLLRMKDIYGGRQFAPAPWLATRSALTRIQRVIDDTGPLVEWLQARVTGAGRKPRTR
jgi:uncharacterized protein (TIGR02453 family)